MCRSVSQEQGAVSFSLNWTKTFRVSGNGRWWKNDRENCLHHVYPENVFLESINCVITEFLMFKQERWNIDKCLVMFSLFILGTSSLLSVIWTGKKYIMYIIFHPPSPWCENLCKQHQCWIPQPFHRRLCCLLKPGLNHYITCNVEITWSNTEFWQLVGHKKSAKLYEKMLKLLFKMSHMHFSFLLCWTTLTHYHLRQLDSLCDSQDHENPSCQVSEPRVISI